MFTLVCVDCLFSRLPSRAPCGAHRSRACQSSAWGSVCRRRRSSQKVLLLALWEEELLRTLPLLLLLSPCFLMQAPLRYDTSPPAPHAVLTVPNQRATPARLQTLKKARSRVSCEEDTCVSYEEEDTCVSSRDSQKSEERRPAALRCV
jgi:hypothetical protein